MRSDTVDQLRREGSYRPWGILENNAEIRKVMNQWESGWILPNEQFVMPVRTREIVSALRTAAFPILVRRNAFPLPGAVRENSRISPPCRS